MKAKTWFERLADGPVRTECLRIARRLVKDELKAQGIKVSDVEASEITRAAKHLCNAEIGILKEAKANLKSLAAMKRQIERLKK